MSTTIPIPAITRQAVCKAFNNGATLVACQRRFKISRSSVKRIIRDGRASGTIERPAARPVSKTLTQTRIEQVTAMAATLTVKEIASELALSRTYVDRLLRAAGVKAVGGRAQLIDSAVADMALTHTATQIADELGMTAQTVYTAAKRADVAIAPWKAPSKTDRAVALA